MADNWKVSLGEAEVYVHCHNGNIHVDIYHPMLKEILNGVRSSCGGSSCGIWIGIPSGRRELTKRLVDGVNRFSYLKEEGNDSGGA